MFSFLIVGGCNNHAPAADPPTSYTLRYENYSRGDDPNLAEYYLNDKKCGVGEIGFETALRQLAKAPTGSSLNVIVPDWTRIGYDDSGYHPEAAHSGSPYFEMNLHWKLIELLNERHIASMVKTKE